MRKCNNFSEESNKVDHGSSTYREAPPLPKPLCSSAPPPVNHGRDLCLPSPASTSTSSTDVLVAAALRIHSLAEKRRRERINTHLATLRRMIPNSNKMDKASVLARVIEQVRALDQNAVNISKTYAIPSETNRVIVECENGRRSNFSSPADEEVQIKATLCCDERPDLISDLNEAFGRLKLITVRAELTSLGGRSHNTFTLCIKDGNENVCINSLMESIRKVLTEIVSTRDY